MLGKPKAPAAGNSFPLAAGCASCWAVELERGHTHRESHGGGSDAVQIKISQLPSFQDPEPISGFPKKSGGPGPRMWVLYLGLPFISCCVTLRKSFDLTVLLLNL